MLIAATVEAIYDVWFVGDDFMRQSMNTLPTWRSQAAGDKNFPQPYVYDYYNVFFYTQRKCASNMHVISRITNSLIEGFNHRARLPRFIIVLLDKDLIEDVNQFEYGTVDEYRKNLAWLMRQINMLVRRRRLDLMDKKPGAVYNSDPKVIFVRMIKRVAYYNKGHRMEKVCSFRTKFNDILEEVVAEFDYHIMSIHACCTEDCFDPQGKLTYKGKNRYWQEMDELIENFDKKKIALMPKTHKQKGRNENRK